MGKQVTTNQSPKRDPLEVLHGEIQDELGKWHKLGMSTKGAVVDHFINDVRLDTLVKFLVEKKVLEEDELNFAFGNELLNRLRGIRVRNEDAMRQAPRLFGPNGEGLF